MKAKTMVEKNKFYNLLLFMFWVRSWSQEHYQLRTAKTWDNRVSLLKPNLQYDGSQKWGPWEVIRSWGCSLHEQGCSVNKETSESSLAPSALYRHTKKTTINEPGIGFHQTLNLDLALPRLQNCEKCQLFISYPVSGVL